MLANAVTLSRLFFLALCIYLLHLPGFTSRIVAFALVIFILFIDAIDGTIARRRGDATPLGAVLDIAIDRVVENVYWITFVSLELVPLWVALVFVTRGILTDAVRGFAMSRGMTPFEMMRSRLGRWLVSQRFMRATYGLVKAITFPGLALLHALHTVWPGTPNERFLDPLETTVFVLVLLSVIFNLVRGIPVLIESRRFFTDPSLSSAD